MWSAKLFTKLSILCVCLSWSFFPLSAQNKIPKPEAFFGFELGSDRNLAHWDNIVPYFYALEESSPNIKIINMGPSTEGHPFLAVIISSEENLSNLETLKHINQTISDPRGLDPNTLDDLISKGKAVIFQSMGLHASEVGGTQMAPELAYDLLTREDEETQRILDNVLFFMIPSLNPDGQVMITDWYRKTVGTEYEGISMPYLYHKYSGHDNNRDGDYHNLIESRYMAQLMFVDWPAQAYIDHHHMGSYGARFYVPPYCDPIRPFADPLVWREISWYGSHIAYKLEEQGFQGVLNAAQFAGWGHFGWHWITPFHNIAGMLTESASVRYATPVYIHPEQLRANSRQFPEYEAQATFPNPWPGGWWHLRDIVEQKKSSAWSLLDLAARNKETVLRTAYLKAKNQTERGATGPAKALVIPYTQHDYLSSIKMINTLLRSGIEIHQAKENFLLGNKLYRAKSFLISLAQPKMGLIRNLLMETRYADNAWTRKEDGTPIYPYDLATHTMNEFMGVTVEEAATLPLIQMDVLNSPVHIKGSFEQGQKGYVLDGKQNASYTAVNILLTQGVRIQRLDKSIGEHHPGDFIVPNGSERFLESLCRDIGVSFKPINDFPESAVHEVKKKRLGLFQRFNGGNMDEGWTRLCFENHSFAYETIHGKEVKAGALKKKWDVIVLPSDSPSGITGVYPASSWRKPEKYPDEYQSGIGKEGIPHLKEFVEQGGTLIALGSSYEFVVKEFDLKISELTQNLDSKEFFCPGSTLKVKVNNTHPLGYGMPEEALVLHRSSPVFAVTPSRQSTDYQTIVRYQDENLLKSGWLNGEEKIAKKPGMIEVKYGQGNIIIIGFRTQHRNQTDGTFKLLFNGILR